MLEAWNSTLARREKQPAIHGPDGATLRTFTEIDAESRHLEAEFKDCPLGSVVAVQIGNSPSWPAVVLALFRLALIPLPLGRHIESGELALVLATCRVGAILHADGGAMRIALREAEPIEWGSPRPDFLKLTSGTTSAPRAIRFRASQLRADAENICSTMGITERDRNFGVIPFSHSYGFSNLITPLLCLGVPLVATEDRLPRAILHDLARSEATVFPGMPVFFRKLAECADPPSLPSLRLCISAGALLPQAVAQRFQEVFRLKIHTFYGASECGGIAYDASDLPQEEGLVGSPMSGVQVDLAAPRETGGITVRSAAVGDGYFPDAEPATLGGGSFAPSDLIRSTERGLVLEGRVSNVINIAGRKLNPIEVEQRLLACPGVRQVVVFGVPSPLRGEEPIACMHVDPGVEASAIWRFCQAELSQWQRPRDIWMLPEIPVNERGKVNRRALAIEYLAQRKSVKARV